MPLPRYFKQEIYYCQCLWKLLFSFPFVFSRHKGYKGKMIWLLLFNTHRFSSVPATVVSGNQWWEACFIGPAKRCEAALLEARGESMLWEGRLLKWRHVKPCGEGPLLVKGTSQIKIHLYSRKGFGQIALCGRKGQHWLQMFRGALGKTSFNEPQDAFLEPGRVCNSSVQI